MGNSYFSMADSLNGMRDAAIESTMQLLGIGGSVDGGFDGGNPPGAGLATGRPLRGQLVRARRQGDRPDGPVRRHDPIGPEWPFHDLPSMVAYYNNRINELFDDWWRIPQDRAFQGLVAQCGHGAQLLASDANLDPDKGTASPFGANVNLSQIATIQQQIGRFDGAAMQAFAANYANRLPIVVDGQDAVASLLWLGAAGEQEIWKRAMQGVADIAAQGRTAMALKKLSRQIADEEDELARHLTQVQGVVTSQSASFDIAAPPIYDDTDPGDFRTADDTKVHFGTLRTIARQTMPMIAGELKKAAGQFDSGSSSGPWTRPAGIGSGSVGPFNEWDSLRATLVGILDNTSLEIDRAADHLEIVADDFEKTDAQIHKDLQAHATQVAKEDEVHLAPTGAGGRHPI